MKKYKYRNGQILIVDTKIDGVLVFRLVSLLIIIICLIQIFLWNKDNKSNSSLISELKSQVVIHNSDSGTDSDDTALNFVALKEQNQDTVAWVKVNNTDIDFPVVKTTNNNYYLNHNFSKEYNSAGWIFADYRNKFDGSDRNLIIYGHNRRDGSMFSSLNKILDDSWYTNPENHIVTLYTPSGAVNYQVFSIYTIRHTDFANTIEFKNAQEYQAYLKGAINSSIYNFNQQLATSDKILTLYTCANNNQYRIILHAKQIR